MFWPLKMSHSFIPNCCCITVSFTTSRMNSWTLSLHWSWLMLTMQYHPYVWLAASRQCPPINDFAAPLDLKLSWPKTKLQTVGIYPGGWGGITTQQDSQISDEYDFYCYWCLTSLNIAQMISDIVTDEDIIALYYFIFYIILFYIL